MESGSSTLRRSLAEGRAEYDNGRNLLLSVVTSFEEWLRVSPCEDLCEALWAFSRDHLPCRPASASRGYLYA